MVSNINEVESSPPNRTNIPHGDYVGFVDPPSTREPSNRINTNRVPPSLPPE